MAYQQPPPAYSQQPGYPPPQQQQGYAPQQQGYAPQPAGYGGYPQAAGQQSSSNVVVVQQPGPQQTVVRVHDDKPNHILHLIITCFCWPWVFVWLILCCIYGC